jgi:hypothetical protein
MLYAQCDNIGFMYKLEQIKFSFREYFNFLFAYVFITYYSLQFLINGDTKQDVARYVVLRIPPLVHLCQICIYLNTHYQKMT